MASREHQWLLLWVARKMSHDGYIVRGFEGPAPQGGLWNHLAFPFEVGGFRPDAWGIHPGTGQLALGEAKSARDLTSARSLSQLRLFGRSLQRSLNTRCPLYLAVPRSAASVLDRVLIRAGLIGATHIVRLHIPDCLLVDALHDCA